MDRSPLRGPALLLAGLGTLGLMIGFAAAWLTRERPPGKEQPAHTGIVAGETAPRPDTPSGGRRALLVGVTRYDHLPAERHLAGPGNDVRAMRQLLRDRYHFPAGNILTLAEGEGAGNRPTRANIERAFRRLAEAARPGDQVVVLLAGHGDRQPESDPPHPLYPEPDGLDEVFLPADVRGWKGQPERVPNAIVDDEIGAWLGAITRKGAYVWAVFDCCHSGHMTRGTEVVRQLPPGTLVPAGEIARARQLAAGRKEKPREASLKPAPFVPRDPSEHLVALSACRPHETTPECLFPADAADARYHGLLTYTLLQVLSEYASSPDHLTYRELLGRIQAKYAGRPGGAPTPTVEGKGQDRVVLGTERRDVPRLTLSRRGGGYRVNAGDMHGLTPGSVLAVHSPAGESAPSEMLGHVRVISAGPFDSSVIPSAFDGKPEPRGLPDGAACRVVYADCRLRQFKVAVQAGAGLEGERKLALAALKLLQDPESGLIRVVEELGAADWVVRLGAAGAELAEASGCREPYPLSGVKGGAFAGELKDKLEEVYRARTLLAVCERLEQERSGDAPEIDLNVEVLLGKDQHKGEATPRPAEGRVFRPGDKVSFKVHNRSRKARVDVQLLVVNPDFKIDAFYPAKDETGKVLEPGESLLTPEGEVTEPPFGREYLVAIATAERQPPVDFRPLLQGGLRGGEDTSPLVQLLARAMHRKGTRSGLERAEAGQHAVRVLTWRTEKR
jgi:hypothetical protein